MQPMRIILVVSDQAAVVTVPARKGSMSESVAQSTLIQVLKQILDEHKALGVRHTGFVCVCVCVCVCVLGHGVYLTVCEPPACDTAKPLSNPSVRAGGRPGRSGTFFVGTSQLFHRRAR